MEFCDSRKSWKGDIIYFCERTGGILREDIKVCNLFIRKNSRAEPDKIISRFTYVQFLVGSNLLKGKGTYDMLLLVTVFVSKAYFQSLLSSILYTSQDFYLIF